MNVASRVVLAVIAALMLVHGVVLLRAADVALAVERADYQPLDFAIVTLAALAIGIAALAAWRDRARAVFAALALLVAVAVLTPGAVAVLLLALLNAHLIGAGILRFVQAPASLPWTVPLLAGIAVWIGVLSATAAMKIHYAGVYAVALIAPLLVGRRGVKATLAQVQAFLAQRTQPRVTELGWLALLFTVFTVHVFMVARPEVGFDAQTMHMQIALIMSETHRFRFDIERYLWALMPMGADWMYAAAYLLAGETAARGANFAFGIVALAVVFQMVRRHAPLEVALASVCLAASTPLAFAETSSLYVENLLAAFLLGATLVVLDMRDTHSPPAPSLAVFALLAAGAMQCKVIGVIWLAPVAAYAVWVAARRATPSHAGWRSAALFAIALVVAAWPYVNALARTGNPVFPFMNRVFKSTLLDAGTSFDNPLYRIPLRPSSFYDLFIDSHRFLEGADGAAGFHWLLLVPLVLFALLRHRSPALLLCLALFVVFFVGVFTQQAYLRYLFPGLLLLAAIGGWAAAGIVDTRIGRAALLAIGAALVLLHIRLIPSGNWPNAQLCATCAFDRQARQEFIATYMGDRIVADYLNRQMPDARIGFLMLNAPSPAGYVGYSRASNWHDDAFYRRVFAATTLRDVEEPVRKYGLTHIVYRTMSPEMENAAIREFKESRTTPVWKWRDFVVASVNP